MQQNIVFGPVFSRRFGVSLGVDLSPSGKQCNFDCLYCELIGQKAQERMSTVLPLKEVLESIQTKLICNPSVNVLTITANGEPTLYPHLYELIKEIKLFVPKDISTLILSNGSRFGEIKVQRALRLFDIVKFSLDGAENKSFIRVDRPYRGISLEALLAGIEDFSKDFNGELVAEVLLVKGVNDSLENIREIAKFLHKVGVDRIDLGSVDRPPAYSSARAIDFDTLSEIAKLFEGMFVSLPKRSQDQTILNQNHSKEELLKLISTRPVSVIEAPMLFNKETLNEIEMLMTEGKVFVRRVANLEFYTTKIKG